MPAPTVSSISPRVGGVVGGTAVTITGTDFTGATGVTIGGVAATSLLVVSATSITCVTPAGSAGVGSVVVTNGSGSNGANSLFVYIPSTPTDTYIYLKGGRGDGFVPLWTGEYSDSEKAEKSEPYRNIFQTTAKTGTSGISGVGGGGEITIPGSITQLANTYATSSALTVTIDAQSDDAAGIPPRQFSKSVTWRTFVGGNGIEYHFRLADVLGWGSQPRA